MTIGQLNPIYQLLTRHIDPIRQRKEVFLAVSATVLGTAAASAVAVKSLMGIPAYHLVLLAPVLILLALAALPVLVGIASSTLAYQEFHDERFDLVLLTTMTNWEIFNGLLTGINQRTKPLLIASTSLSICAILIPALFYLAADQASLGLDIVFTIFMIVILAVVGAVPLLILWGTVALYNDFAIKAGILAVLRFHRAGQGVSTALVTLLIVITEALGPILTLLAGRYAFDGIYFIAAFCFPFIYLVIPIIGNTLVEQDLERYMQSSRRSAE